MKLLRVRAVECVGYTDFDALGCSWMWCLDQASKHGECSSKIIGLVGWYVGQIVAMIGQEVYWDGRRHAQ